MTAQAYADYNDLMNMTEDMLIKMVEEVNGGSLQLAYHADGPDAPPVQIDFKKPWRRISMARTSGGGRRALSPAIWSPPGWLCPHNMAGWSGLPEAACAGPCPRLAWKLGRPAACVARQRRCPTPCRGRGWSERELARPQIAGLEEALDRKLPADLETEDARETLDRLVGGPAARAQRRMHAAHPARPEHAAACRGHLHAGMACPCVALPLASRALPRAARGRGCSTAVWQGRARSGAHSPGGAMCRAQRGARARRGAGRVRPSS